MPARVAAWPGTRRDGVCLEEVPACRPSCVEEMQLAAPRLVISSAWFFSLY